MTSKEALDNLHRCALCYQAKEKDKWIKHCRKVRNIVDKNLDRLEELEEENKDLKLENEELRDLYDLTTNGNWSLKEENTKLKKAIEILKEEPYILLIGLENFAYDKFDNTYYYEEELYSQDLGFRNKIYVISKEKYNLLKEVLEDE